MIIYITTNLINSKKYIGKDSANNSEYLGSGTLLMEDIIKYGKENFKKDIIEYCENDEELSIQESYWIKYHNAVESDDFYNLVDYSAGWNLHKLGKEKYEYICQKISKGKIGKKLGKQSEDACLKKSILAKGKLKPEGFGDKISKIKLSQNIKFSKEHCQKISIAKKDHECFQTESFKILHYKPIEQYNKSGELLKEFKSIDEASLSSPEFKRSNISCCLTGISKTAYGFVWKYKNHT